MSRSIKKGMKIPEEIKGKGENSHNMIGRFRVLLLRGGGLFSK